MAQKQEERTFNIQEWFRLLDEYAAEKPFVLEREQTVAPERAVFENVPPEGKRFAA